MSFFFQSIDCIGFGLITAIHVVYITLWMKQQEMSTELATLACWGKPVTVSSRMASARKPCWHLSLDNHIHSLGTFISYYSISSLHSFFLSFHLLMVHHLGLNLGNSGSGLAGTSGLQSPPQTQHQQQQQQQQQPGPLHSPRQTGLPNLGAANPAPLNCPAPLIPP
jgi:hypothetical protein